MDCAAKGRGGPCVPDRPKRRCGICGAVAYCSSSHQKLHWNIHKEECARFEQQMQRAGLLNDLPFPFSKDTGSLGCEQQSTRCSFLTSSGLHHRAMWKFECRCWTVAASLDDNSRLIDEWELPSSLCPCSEPRSRMLVCLGSWVDYCHWRCLPFSSPAALLLHWKFSSYLTTAAHYLSLLSTFCFTKFNCEIS